MSGPGKPNILSVSPASSAMSQQATCRTLPIPPDSETHRHADFPGFHHRPASTCVTRQTHPYTRSHISEHKYRPPFALFSPATLRAVLPATRRHKSRPPQRALMCHLQQDVIQHAFPCQFSRFSPSPCTDSAHRRDQFAGQEAYPWTLLGSWDLYVHTAPRIGLAGFPGEWDAAESVCTDSPVVSHNLARFADSRIE